MVMVYNTPCIKGDALEKSQFPPKLNIFASVIQPLAFVCDINKVPDSEP